MKLPPSPPLSSLLIAVLLAAAGWLAISVLVVPEVPADTAASHDVRAGHHALAALAQATHHAQAGHHAPVVAARRPRPLLGLTTRRLEPRPRLAERWARRPRSGRGPCRRTPS